MQANKTVVMGLSGGVDSAVASLLLQREGYTVIGATLWLHGETADVADAQRVCTELEIEHIVLDWRERFQHKVVDAFIEAYCSGCTPNPCVRCNPEIKFRALLEEADRRGGAWIATGHYARVVCDESAGRWRLRPGGSKDQSYALYALGQDILRRVKMPLGALLDKEEARRMAREAGLSVAEKSDSQDICFIPGGDYADFLHRHAPGRCKPGYFVGPDGDPLGEHKGIWHYTIGQRKGLGLGLGRPMFVQRIDARSGDITLCDNEALLARELSAGEVNWIDFERLEHPLRLHAKIRYNHRPQPAQVFPLGQGRIRVVFDRPQRAITPGQSVVLYNGEYVAGGGVIDGPETEIFPHTSPEN